MKCQLSSLSNLCYDGQQKNVLLLVVDRDIQCLQTNAKDDLNVMDDNKKSFSISRDKTDNITFRAKSFLVHGPYENFIKIHMQPSDFLKLSIGHFRVA